MRGRLIRRLAPAAAAAAAQEEGLEWTAEQREALQPHWREYQERVRAIRGQARAHLAAMQAGAAASVLAWDAHLPSQLRRMADIYSSLIYSAGGVDAWTRLETVASVELLCALLRVRAAAGPGEGAGRGRRAALPALLCLAAAAREGCRPHSGR